MSERCKASQVEEDGYDGYEVNCILREDHNGPHIAYDDGEEMIIFGRPEEVRQALDILDRAYGND